MRRILAINFPHFSGLNIIISAGHGAIFQKTLNIGLRQFRLSIHAPVAIYRLLFLNTHQSAQLVSFSVVLI